MGIEPKPTHLPWGLRTARRRFPRPERVLLGLLVGITSAGSLGGCGDADLPPGLSKKAIAIDEVPDALRAAAKKAVPGVPFKEAWQNLDPQGKLHSYEIRGKQPSDGKIREVRVSPTGEILESE
jgi:hypothetical protein